MTTNIQYFIHIEGIGGFGQPLAWTHDGAEKVLPGTAADAQFDFDFQISDLDQPTLLPPDQNFDAQRVYAEPFEAKSRSGQATIKFRALEGVGARLLRRSRRAIAQLDTALAPGDTTVELDRAIDDVVVYVGHETIELGPENGSTYTNSTRGYNDSTATHHSVGANVYNVVPVWAGRMVTLYTYHVEDDELVQRERYRITEEDGQAIGMNQGVITMPVRGPTANRSQWAVNTSPKTVGPTPNEDGEFHDIEVREEGGNTRRFGVFANSAIRKQDENVSIVQKWRAGDFWLLPPTDQFGARQGTFNVEDEAGLEADEWRAYTGEVTEVLDVPFDTGPLSSMSGVTNSDIAPRHPVAIDAAVCLSTVATSEDVDNFDIFQAPHFGLGLRWLFEDGIVARAKSLIDQHPDRLIDRLVIGGDGKPIEWLDWADTHLLQPFGFYRAVTDNGTLTYQSIDLADVDDYSTALGNVVQAKPGPGDEPGPLSFETGRGHISDSVQITYRDLPWQEPSSQLVRAVENDSPRTNSLQSRADSSIELGVVQSEAAITRQGIAQLLFQHYQMPRVTVRVHDYRETGADYGIGEQIVLDDLPLTDPYLYDRDGARVASINDDPRFIGTIISRQPNYGGDALTYRLTLLLTNFSHNLARWRAPSARVKSYSANTVTLQDGQTDFGDTADDAARFTVGDEVAAWSIDGTLQGGTAEITAISGGGGSDWTFDLDGDIGAQADDYLRLAPYDDYANANVIANIDRPYVFLGDAQATAEISGDEEADVYG